MILPASNAPGNPSENTLLPGTVAELQPLGITPREVALDGGFMPTPTNSALADLQPKQGFITGRHEPASKRTSRRLRRYRTGAESRISHLKRRYRPDQSRLKGDRGQQTWTDWGILAHNTDTLAVRNRRNTPHRSFDKSKPITYERAAHRRAAVSSIKIYSAASS